MSSQNQIEVKRKLFCWLDISNFLYIIVLLILAGVTIAQLTGSDSAPTKANEAKQKNDIGAAKDDVYLTTSNAQTEAYERVYVEGKQINSDDYVTAGNASTEVGTYVRNKLNQKYGTDGSFKIGLATITASATGDITITTTDFTQPGEISAKGGNLIWNEMVANGGTQQQSGGNQQQGGETTTYTITYLANGGSGTMTATTGTNPAVAENEFENSGYDFSGWNTAADGSGSNYTAGTTVSSNLTLYAQWTLTPANTGATASEVNAAIGQIINYSANNVSSWRVFYADANYMYIISTTNAVTGYGLDGDSKAGKNKYSDGALSAVFTTPQSGGKKNYSNVTYGATYNSKWLATGTSDNQNRSRAAAYLCDPSEWDDFVSSTAPSGTFAVGGPTKELLVNSWNEAKANGRTGDPTTTATWNDSSDVGQDGYTGNSPLALSSSDKIITTSVVPVTVSGTSYGLYNPINTTSDGIYGYWLASPCSSENNDGFMCCVSCKGYMAKGAYLHPAFGIRPVVAIPISSVTVSSGTVSIN